MSAVELGWYHFHAGHQKMRLL